MDLELPFDDVRESSRHMKGKATSEERIRRVIQLSRINGWSIVGFAGLCAIVVLLFGDLFGFSVGVAIAVGGWMELHGNQLLKKQNIIAFRWLAGSQIYLIIVLWSYCYNNIVRFDPSDPWERLSPEFKNLILSINPDTYLIEELLKVTYYATYIAVIVTVLIYQGGLCLFYLSRKKYLYSASE